MLGMAIAINKTADKKEMKELYCLGGAPTNAMDSLVIRKSMEICWVIKEHRLLLNIKQIGKTMDSLLEGFCKEYNKVSYHFQMAVYGGIGCLWYTNLKLYSNQEEILMEYGRLFPLINIDSKIFISIIKSKNILADFSVEEQSSLAT